MMISSYGFDKWESKGAEECDWVTPVSSVFSIDASKGQSDGNLYTIFLYQYSYLRGLNTSHPKLYSFAYRVMLYPARFPLDPYNFPQEIQIGFIIAPECKTLPLGICRSLNRSLITVGYFRIIYSSMAQEKYTSSG